MSFVILCLLFVVCRLRSVLSSAIFFFFFSLLCAVCRHVTHWEWPAASEKGERKRRNGKAYGLQTAQCDVHHLTLLHPVLLLWDRPIRQSMQNLTRLNSIIETRLLICLIDMVSGEILEQLARLRIYLRQVQYKIHFLCIHKDRNRKLICRRRA